MPTARGRRCCRVRDTQRFGAAEDHRFGSEFPASAAARRRWSEGPNERRAIGSDRPIRDARVPQAIG
jgi:hypothetical protein